MPPITLAIVGAGGRGTGYASYAAKYPEEAKVVGVAEPRDYYRDNLARVHAIPEKHVFTDWAALARRRRFADAAVVATQDDMHAGPATALARKGYHILLEKPMAPSERDCRRIVAAATKAGIVFAVGHVMRYTRYTQKLKALLAAGAVGDVVSLQHLEPVGYWHQAHSFVRGNWRNSILSSPMLLAKSCHDLDWIRYMMGVPCLRVASFGTLKHFRQEEAPQGAAARCLDCSVEPTCPYSALKIYVRDRLEKGRLGWPLDVLTPQPTRESVLDALRNGPYGRCVYACDNDVVDHQVVSMEFAGGRTATFTMTAFNRGGHRKTRIFGTRGEIHGDGEKITHYDFLTDKTQEIDTTAPDPTILGGHGGGDFGLMHSFVAAVARNDPGLILSGPQETLESHLIVFAAEKARNTGRVVGVRG